MKDYIFTSESITAGHPDKICDQIADAILDEALRQDKNSKMAVEATIKDEFVLVYGEANTTANIDFENIAKIEDEHARRFEKYAKEGVIEMYFDGC